MTASEPRLAKQEVRRIVENGDVAEVVALLDSPERLVRIKAINAIKKRHLTEAAPVLGDLAANDEDMKIFALLTLEQLALPESRETFLDTLAGDDKYVRLV